MYLVANPRDPRNGDSNVQPEEALAHMRRHPEEIPMPIPEPHDGHAERIEYNWRYEGKC